MQIITYLQSLLPNLTYLEIRAQVRINVDTNGRATIAQWNVANVNKPTDDQLNAALAEPEPLSSLINQLKAAASSVCSSITAQVIPDETHRNAYSNAVVWVSNNKAPTIEPARTVFANCGASVGISNPDQFAGVVMAVSLGALQLSTILSTLGDAANKAQTSADLAEALTMFETDISTFVSGLNNVGLTISVTPPPAIVIEGINS